MPVRLCLAALPGQRLDGIERVYSHIQALGQAETFLRARPWQLLTTYNTAGAGKSIVDRGERGAAAVLSPRAAALFGLEVLADDIGDLPGNRTRFVVLARAGATAPLPGSRARTPPRGRPSSSPSATSPDAARGPPGLRRPRPQHEQARVTAQPRARLGVRLLGRPRRRRSRSRRPQAALTPWRAVTTMVRVLGSYPRRAEA